MQQNKKRSGVADAGLDQGQQRILRWLERYPFQRAQDLVVALSPWEGRGAAYRRIAELETRHLIESVRFGASTREHLYHLSPVGRSVCAGWNVERGRQGRTLVLREEREKLVRLLPRLPVWLIVQDLVNGLVLGAARALARAGTGQEAEHVHWNWARDYTHAFVARGREARLLRVHADGALTLCLRFASPQTGATEEWLTFLLLHCPLDDGRLLRSRLDRIVRWRESEERWPVYSQMPPVLILATTPRQAEWWQRAWAQVTTNMRVDGPLGAMACLPKDQRIGNSWRLAWRTLGTNESCHIRELAQPGSAPALPELAEVFVPWERILRQEAEQVWQVPPYPGRCSYELAAKAQEAAERNSTRTSQAHGSVPSAADPNHVDYRLMSLFLVPRQWEILSLVFAHPLLSRDELSIVLGMRPKPAQILLADLAQKDILTRKETTVGGRWQLSEAGLRLQAHRASCHVYRFVRLPVTPGAPLVQRGVAGLVHQMRHTVGIYRFFTTLMSDLTASPVAWLRWWETGAMCEHVFVYREQTYHFKPDALASVQLGAREVRMWLEWDRGTMGVRDLERKCATYAAYLSSREWARTGAYPPALVYVAPEIAQERRFVKTAGALLAHIPGLRLYTTTASLLDIHGVLTPIWQPVTLQTTHSRFLPAGSLERDTLPEHVSRVALFAEE
ncbi:MAG: replication-relaxation family protein [Ktedonobacteraceae bacterium]